MDLDVVRPAAALASLDALVAIGYDGWLTVESFGDALPNLAAATKIWRPLFDSQEQVAVEGLAFMKREVAARTWRTVPA